MVYTFRDAGVRVRVTDGISKGSTGVTTGDQKDTELSDVKLVGVQLAHRFRYVREDFLEPEPFRYRPADT